MKTHVMLPEVPLQSGFIHQAYERYLREWREQAKVDADKGETAASICHQAVLIDLVLEGKVEHDWLSVMNDLLTKKDGSPAAYSKDYGKRLCKFEKQYLQSTVHSIHTRWWVERLQLGPRKVDLQKFANMIMAKLQTDNLIYDADISETILAHRMKTELSMSAAMGAEILSASGCLTDQLKNKISTALCHPKKVPPLGYMTSEQFRLAALRFLSHEEQFPVGIGKYIEACAEGLDYGWCDFSMKSKVDVYMGTAKRTSRDKAIHSPIVACHVAVLSKKVEEACIQTAIKERLIDYANRLAINPLDIPAFQMRDVPIPFGPDRTPIEAVCASWLIKQYSTKK